MTPADLDFDALEKTAKEATPGPWSVDPDAFGRDDGWSDAMAIAATVGRQKIYARAGSNYPSNDQRYIAAANPETVLVLLALARRTVEAEARAAEMDRDALDDQIIIEGRSKEAITLTRERKEATARAESAERELSAAWEATTIAGCVRGFGVSLAEIISSAREDNAALRGEVARLRATLATIRTALDKEPSP